ncbi:MAG: class I SAM-dependent rRNA methyltransferase [Sandaracinaceae bacterium]|nr:class I SAM-dependent rRNA methyltransferase [Sandaracinaceae bacterium]
MARITLRKGRVQPVWAGHPWVFAQAIERLDGAPAPGDAVDVLDPTGKHLGRGFWSADSAIPVRLITRDEAEPLDEAALVRRLERAHARRQRLGIPDADSDAYRLVHAEGDELPGLIVDVYRDVAVLQLLTHGMKRREDALAGAVARIAGARVVAEARGGRMQEKEGIAVVPRILRGPDRPQLRFRERGLEYAIELGLAQKTGFYFDQRDNRALVERLARGRRVLDLYSYVGPFALAAARGGARSVHAFDKSAAVVSAAASIAAANGLADRVEIARQDVKSVLSRLGQDGARYDLAIVDPPKLAPTARHLERARSAYRRLNAQVLALMAPGALVLSCSCSAAMRPDELVRTIALAARDVGKRVRLLHLGQQGMDHPVPAAFPEGRYLKAALVEVD